VTKLGHVQRGGAAGLFDRMLGTGYSVMTLIEEGNPATEILGEEESGQYDLVVLGAADAMDSKHTMLGSVSAKVAWQAPCSVAVVKLRE
jgi:nucleotide-binding universal stress UspA family protein